MSLPSSTQTSNGTGGIWNISPITLVKHPQYHPHTDELIEWRHICTRQSRAAQWWTDDGRNCNTLDGWVHKSHLHLRYSTPMQKLFAMYSRKNRLRRLHEERRGGSEDAGLRLRCLHTKQSPLSVSIPPLSPPLSLLFYDSFLSSTRYSVRPVSDCSVVSEDAVEGRTHSAVPDALLFYSLQINWLLASVVFNSLISSHVNCLCV